MTSEIEPRIIKLGRHHVLCDADIATRLTEHLFDPEKLKQRGWLTGRALGRGEAWFLNYRGHDWVLRHFRRGGQVGRFVVDCYLGWSLERSRSWAEWRLLAELRRLGLPVPRPVAAAVQRGWGYYRAELLTERIPETLSLAARLTDAAQSEEFWRALGACLRRFHDQGVWHADLNANNILIDSRSRIYLIDFDRGKIRAPGGWARQNLQRLQRSLLKIKAASTDFHFDDADWQRLLQGYASSC
jgi:3-deoxy-D-manno-octulosonic acid kinase